MVFSKFGWGSTSFQTSNIQFLATFPSPMCYFPVTLMMKGSNGCAMAARPISSHKDHDVAIKVSKTFVARGVPKFVLRLRRTEKRGKDRLESMATDDELQQCRSSVLVVFLGALCALFYRPGYNTVLSFLCVGGLLSVLCVLFYRPGYNTVLSKLSSIYVLHHLKKNTAENKTRRKEKQLSPNFL
jgi:hypothetical protein